MENTYNYGKLTKEQLRDEVVELTCLLTTTYNDLATCLMDQQKDYLTAYAQSPGGSVAAKNREAQYYTEDLTRQVFSLRANINSIALKRDLAILLMGFPRPDKLPFPEIAGQDPDGLAVV